jgi:hypothetical protein
MDQMKIQTLSGVGSWLGDRWDDAKGVGTAVANFSGDVVAAPMRALSAGFDAVGFDWGAEYARKFGNVLDKTTTYSWNFAVNPIGTTRQIYSNEVMDNIRMLARRIAKRETLRELDLEIPRTGLPSNRAGVTNTAMSVLNIQEQVDTVVNRVLVALYPAKEATMTMIAGIASSALGQAAATETARAVGSYIWDKEVSKVLERISNSIISRTYRQAVGFIDDPEIDNLSISDTADAQNLNNIERLSMLANAEEWLRAKANEIITGGVGTITGDDTLAIRATVQALYMDDYRAWLNRYDYAASDDALRQYWVDLTRAQSRGYSNWSQDYNAAMNRSYGSAIASAQAKQAGNWRELGYPSYESYINMTVFARQYNLPIMPFGEWQLRANQAASRAGIASSLAALQASKANAEFVKKQASAKTTKTLGFTAAGAFAIWSLLK